MQLCGLFRFPSMVGVSPSCLGRTFPIRVGGRRGHMTLPQLAWDEGEQAQPRLVTPSTGLGSDVDARIARIAKRAEAEDGVFDYWGAIGSWKPATRDIDGGFIEAVWVRFSLGQSDTIEHLDYVDGPGSPRGEPVSRLFRGIDLWFDVFRTWAEVLGEQDLDPSHPLKFGAPHGGGLSLFSYDGTEASLPGGPHEISVVMHDVRPLPVRQLSQAIRRANAGGMPSDPWLLFRDATAAHRRGNSRRAVIEAGTAVEMTLADYNTRVTRAKPKKGLPTLGWYVTRLKTAAGLPSATMSDLVRRRNDAIHAGKVPSWQDAERALAIAKQILDAHDPLPA